MLNRFKAYSEKIKSSASKSIRPSCLDGDVYDEKNSSVGASFAIKDIKIHDYKKTKDSMVCL